MAEHKTLIDGGLILAVAAPAEARAMLSGFGADLEMADQTWMLHRVAPQIDVLVTGVGKVNAGAALAHVILPTHHEAVISVGVAGALPGSGLSIGDVVVAERSVYADEGLIAPDGFSDVASMGFAPAPEMDGCAAIHDGATVNWLGQHADRLGVIATVSTCSGTDEAASAVVGRTGAIAEAMEGAAIGHVAARLGLRSAEVRAISNTTGNRAEQIWDLNAALSALTRFIASSFVR